MAQKKVTSSVILMSISLLLLVVLQVLWLKTEYRTAVDSFSRETNMTFRSTLHQLSDSLISRGIRGMEGNDTIIDRSHEFKHISAKRSEHPDTLLRADSDDSTRKIVVSIKNAESRGDSIIFSKQYSSIQEMRWIMAGEVKDFDLDSISLYYRQNLNPSLAQLDFKILEKEFTFNRPRQPFQSVVDSLPFTTSFYPFARQLYAVEFQNAGWLIYKKLIPQAGFAIITTGLIFVSFLLVYRNLRNQQKLMEQKDSFISNVSHELKTPVATVSVALEAMKNFDVLKDEAKAREYLELASQELNRLGMMTDKILKTSVLDYSNEIMNHKKNLNLGELAAKVLTSFEVVARQKEVDLVVDTIGNTNISGNEEHATQMLYNLVDNALKYAAEGKIVEVNIKESEKHVILEVADKGPGISAEHQRKIFDKFYRIPTGNVHNVKGYGLGLHYVAGVVKQHSGKISLESNLGKGCKFVIKLPKA